MSRWAKFRQTLEQPTYRTKLAFFLILGFTVVLLAVLLQSRSPFWSEILLQFAVTFIAVGVLQLLWDFLGGEPLELRIEEVKGEVRSIGQPIAVLSDLINGNIGIERIWPDRRAWRADLADGLSVWQARVCQARRVDIMSNTLWNNWMKQEEFRQRLFEHIAQGTAAVRILVYDPDADVLSLRARDEEELVVPGEMQIEIVNTLRRVVGELNDLPVSVRANLEVRLTHQTLHLAQVIRADERMLVANYLTGKSGGPSPTMQLRGSDSSYFRKYDEQFEILWRRARLLDDDRISQIVQKYGGLPTPSVVGG
jgi:hypothetical protein